jgi:catechol 2,3-dioxygenase-like lactoylglutathione lyase family enzyme
MNLNHVGLVCSSEANCDRFYGELLQLEKLESKSITAELAIGIFGLNAPYQMLNYGNDGVKFEIFLSDRRDFVESQIGHVCLEVDDLVRFLETCTAMQVEVRTVPKGDSQVTFIKDYDDNLFEIKQSK